MTLVRVGTGLDEDVALAVWQAAEAGEGRRNGGSRAQRVRARLRSPLALLLLAEAEVREAVGPPTDGLDPIGVEPDGAALGGAAPVTVEPVGILLAEVDRVDGLVVALLAVVPAAQRSGVARALLEALLDRYPEAAVRLGPADHALQGVLARLGFDAVAPPPDDGSLLLRRPLPASRCRP